MYIIIRRAVCTTHTYAEINRTYYIPIIIYSHRRYVSVNMLTLVTDVYFITLQNT